MDDRTGWADAADRSIVDRRSAEPSETRDEPHPVRRRAGREVRAGDPRSWGDSPIARARRPAEAVMIGPPRRVVSGVAETSAPSAASAPASTTPATSVAVATHHDSLVPAVAPSTAGDVMATPPAIPEPHPMPERRAAAGRVADEASASASVRAADDPGSVLVEAARTLCDRAARLADAATARRLLDEADMKLAVAATFGPLAAEAMLTWATVTAALARRAETPAEAERLFDLADDRFAEAAQRQPECSDALAVWAGDLVVRATTCDDPDEAERLHGLADAVFAQALRVHPRHYDVLCDRVAALISLAHRADDLDAADAVLDRAEQACRVALSLVPDETYTFACIAALRGRTEDCREALEAAERAATLPAAEHVAADEDLAAVRGEPWFRELIDRRRLHSTAH